MAAKRTLRVATEADAKPAKPKSLTEAAEGGDYRELLVAQRMDIARSLQDPNTQGPARAALHRQLGLIARELKDLDVAAQEEAAENVVTPDSPFDASAI